MCITKNRKKPRASTQKSRQPPRSIQRKKKPQMYTAENLQNAIKDVQTGVRSFAAAWKFHNIPKGTLYDRLNGAKSRHEANETNQILSPPQEEALTYYIQYRGWRGDPVTSLEARELAARIGNCDLPAEGWFYRFLRRGQNLRMGWARKGEGKRAQAMKRVTTSDYFDLLQEQIEKYDIHPSDIYNADEKGIFMGGGDIRFRAVVDANQKQAFCTGDENRKMVTVLECIGARGDSIRPLLIHEGIDVDGEWVRKNCCNAE
ncbi:12013_t:CDS:1 [Acaulospora colombiana]|uniref:12013_t:CDS:1 n=1 Tax=Acaulospora colombiana TaxID=27376 RepID=A0ACA9PFY7_9GLOM|nr:12013_t:CDS:1 [Acaulospora colombiana]